MHLTSSSNNNFLKKFCGILLQLWVCWGFFAKEVWIFRHRSYITDKEVNIFPYFCVQGQNDTRKVEQEIPALPRPWLVPSQGWPRLELLCTISVFFQWLNQSSRVSCLTSSVSLAQLYRGKKWKKQIKSELWDCSNLQACKVKKSKNKGVK